MHNFLANKFHDALVFDVQNENRVLSLDVSLLLVSSSIGVSLVLRSLDVFNFLLVLHLSLLLALLLGCNNLCMQQSAFVITYVSIQENAYPSIDLHPHISHDEFSSQSIACARDPSDPKL
jgi:hypothetical protein